MINRAKIELGILGLLLLIFILLLYPALIHARREGRDGIRRTELINMKRELEQFFNENEKYPLEYKPEVHSYAVTGKKNGGAVSWYVRAVLENKSPNSRGFDEEYNVYWRVISEDGKTYYDICGGENQCDFE